MTIVSEPVVAVGQLHQATDPEPVPGSQLYTGSRTDRITVLRLESGQWTWWHNGDKAQDCSYELVKFWCPMTWQSRPRGSASR